MFVKFNARKATQAAGVLFRLEHGRRMTRLRLLKLLLIADRHCIKTSGRPVLGSKIVAMDNGPLHSDVYNLIKGEHVDVPEWSQHFAPDGPRDVVMVIEPGVELLSRKEIELLQAISERHAHIDDFQLSELTHGFSEWEKYYRANTSTVIPLEEVIAAVGRSADLNSIQQDLNDDAAIDAFFSNTTR